MSAIEYGTVAIVEHGRVIEHGRVNFPRVREAVGSVGHTGSPAGVPQLRQQSSDRTTRADVVIDSREGVTSDRTCITGNGTGYRER